MTRTLRACLCAALTLAAPVTSAASPRPNVFVVMADDQGYGELSRQGNPTLECTSSG